MAQQKKLDELFKLAKEAFSDDDRSLYIVEILSEYLKYRPNHGYAWTLYGESLGVIERYSEALDALKRALDLCPQNRLHLVLSRIAFICGKCLSPSEAESWYSRAIESAGPKPEGWILVLRGANLRLLEKYEEAESSLKMAVDLDTEEKAEAYVNLALLRRAQGRYEEAGEYSEKALQIEPDSEDAQKILRSLELVKTAIKLTSEE